MGNIIFDHGKAVGLEEMAARQTSRRTGDYSTTARHRKWAISAAATRPTLHRSIELALRPAHR